MPDVSAAPPSEALPQASSLDGLAEQTDADVSRIRRTNDVPPRASVFDTFQVLLGIQQTCCTIIFQRLCRKHEEVLTLCKNFKIPGRGNCNTTFQRLCREIEAVRALCSKRKFPAPTAPADIASAAPPSEALPQASGLGGLAELTEADCSRNRKTALPAERCPNLQMP